MFLSKNTKIALITGASSGIGAQTAIQLAKNNYFIIINYLDNLIGAEKIDKKIKSAGGHSEIIQADITDKQQTDALFDKIIKKHHRIDVLVNNASSVTLPANWSETTPLSWQKTVDINLTSTFFCIQKCAPIMVKQKSGKIINISSVSGIIGAANAPAYSTAKAGIINLTKTFAKTLAPYVTVNCIAPGYINTRWHNKKDKNFFQTVENTTPLRRIGQPEDIANAVEFLVSPKANYITGITLTIDGGASLK